MTVILQQTCQQQQWNADDSVLSYKDKDQSNLSLVIPKNKYKNLKLKDLLPRNPHTCIFLKGVLK